VHKNNLCVSLCVCVCVFVCKSVYTHVYSNDTKIMHQKKMEKKKDLLFKYSHAILNYETTV